MSDRGDQARIMAHLRPLQRCSECGRPATLQLFNGLNAPMNWLCDRHGEPALKRFRESK